MQNTPTNGNLQALDNTGGLDIISLLRRYLRNWYWFLILIGLAYVAAWANLQSEPYIYSISGKVLIDQGNNAVTSIDPQGLISPLASGSGGSLSDEIEIIQSRQLMAQVVEKLNLQKSYYVDTRFGLKEVFDQLPFSILTAAPLDSFYGSEILLESVSNTSFSLTINKTETISGEYNEPLEIRGVSFLVSKNGDANQPLIIRINSPISAARRYIGGLSVAQVKRSRVLEIGLNDPFPNRATNIINELIMAYDAYVLNNNRLSANTTIDFIDDRLKLITSELFDVEKQVENYKRSIDVPLDLSRSASDYLAEISTNDRFLGELELRRTLLTNINDKLSNEFSDLDFLPFSLDLGGIGFNTNLINEFNELISERNRLLVSATNENPSVKIINDELAKTKVNILNWIKLKQEEIVKQEEFYQSQLSPIENKIDDIPQYERELLQIMRQQKIKETLFTYLLQRREETAISLAAEVTNTRIVDSPIVNRLVSPNKNRIYMMYVLLGFAIPGFLLFLIELSDKTVHNETELKELSKAPFLGSVPKTKIQGRILKEEEAKSVTSEMIRLIRTNLNFLLNKETDSNVILVTSTQSGEGKTFVSVNLAATIAQSGKSVIAIELDLRKPKLREYIGGKDSEASGVSNYLSGAVSDVELLIQQVDGFDGLSYMASGPIPPNPSELIMGNKMSVLIDHLRTKYEVIILDTPPVGMVTDALLLKDSVDASVYIVRASQTKKKDITIFNDIKNDQKLSNPGLVLNGVKIGRSYGNYQRYGYYHVDNSNRFQRLKRKLFGSKK